VFRVFDGTQDVSAETRITVRASGSTEEGTILNGPQLSLDLPPGIYDAQAIRHRAGRVLSVRWAERLVIVSYPDEGDEHLEVINLTSGFGALQLRLPPDVRPDPGAVKVEGGTPGAPARVFAAPGYLLVVAPAGTYTISVALPAGPETLADVEIPADRTRMRTIGEAGP
jgi:hypothetical protein